MKHRMEVMSCNRIEVAKKLSNGCWIVNIELYSTRDPFNGFTIATFNAADEIEVTYNDTTQPALPVAAQPVSGDLVPPADGVPETDSPPDDGSEGIQEEVTRHLSSTEALNLASWSEAHPQVPSFGGNRVTCACDEEG